MVAKRLGQAWSRCRYQLSLISCTSHARYLSCVLVFLTAVILSGSMRGKCLRYADLWLKARNKTIQLCQSAVSAILLFIYCD